MSDQFDVEVYIQQCLSERQAREDAERRRREEAEAGQRAELIMVANKAREDVLGAIPAPLRDYLKAFDEVGEPVTPARLYLPGCTPIVVGARADEVRFMPTWAAFDPDTYENRIFYAYKLISTYDIAEAICVARESFASIAEAQAQCKRWNERKQVASTPAPVHGVCRVCGCTDERACEGGCYWVDDEHTLCSQCAEKEAPQPDPLALTPDNVSQAHVALAEARNAIFGVATVLDQIKVQLKTQRAQAVADGRISGKNEDVREAQSREIFAADYAALADAEAELDKAQLAYDLAEIEVKRQRALICLATTKGEPIPF
jgi:hypothetical protein